MFSFQKSDELVFHQIPCSISFQQQARDQQDLVVLEVYDHVTMEGNTNSSVPKARKRHGDKSPSSKPTSSNTEVVEDSKDEHAQRKLAHRETERQRRQDMAKLYASLRGLLPLEFVKGKRSTSDHMHQAVKYIKHMQEKIRVQSVQRDRLKKFVETSVPCSEKNANERRFTNLLPNTVSISSCNRGNQILINSCLIEDGFPLSVVLKAISEEGLSVITCTCTKVNGRLFHCIQSEKKTSSGQADDQVPTDLSMLHQRLTAVANNY